MKTVKTTEGIEFKLPENLAEALNWIDTDKAKAEAIAGNWLLAIFKIRAQDKVRSAIKNEKTPAEVTKMINDWRPGAVRISSGPKVTDPVEKELENICKTVLKENWATVAKKFNLAKDVKLNDFIKTDAGKELFEKQKTPKRRATAEATVKAKKADAALVE